MNKLKFFWENTIFRTLFILFLIIFIPIYLLAGGIYYWGISKISNEMTESIKAQNQNFVNNVENEIKRIKKMQFDFVNDDSLNSLAFSSQLMNDIERTFAIVNVQKRITIISNSSTYIKRVIVYVPDIEMGICSEGNPSGSISNVPKDEYSMLINLPNDSDSQLIFWKNRLFLSSVNPTVFMEGTVKTPFIIEIELDKDKFLKEFFKQNLYEGSGALLIRNQTNYLIANTPMDQVYKQIFKFNGENLKNQENSVANTKINNKNFLMVKTKSKYLNMTLIKYVSSSDVFSSLNDYSKLFIVLSIFAFMVIVLYSIFIYKIVHKPLFQFVKGFNEIENENFNVTIVHKHNDEFRYLYNSFNSMVDKLKILIEQVYKQKILMQKAELKQLQAQINPHFLYNSFFVLKRMIRINDNEAAINFSKHLGNYFQYITRNSLDEVELEKEVAHAKVYADIQGLRFENRVSIYVELLPEELKKFVVPRLILQPILENAFQHGLESKLKDGKISVNFKYSIDCFQIIIEDNGNEIKDLEIQQIIKNLDSEDNESEVTGIINIHRRIKLKFGNESGLRIERGDLGGLKVTIDIVK